MLPVAAAGDSDPGVFDLCGMAVPRGRPRGFILTGTVLARMMLCRMGLAPAGYLGSGSLRQSLPGDSHRASLGGGELVVSRTLQTPEPGSASHFTDRRRDYSRQGSGSQGSGLLVHLDEFASSVAPARMLRRVEMVSPPPEGPSGEEAGGGVGGGGAAQRRGRGTAMLVLLPRLVLAGGGHGQRN